MQGIVSTIVRVAPQASADAVPRNARVGRTNNDYERDFHESLSPFDSGSGNRRSAGHSQRHHGAIRRGHAARARASQRRCDGKERRHRRDAPHTLGRRWQLHPGRSAARHLSGGCRRRHRNRGDTECCLHRDTGPGERRSNGRSRSPDAGSRGERPQAERSADLGSRHQRVAGADRKRAADDAQLPRVRRHRARRGVPGRRQRQDLDAWRCAECERRESLHRWRRPEGLRALGCQRPGRRHAGQSVPAARHRRIQGHHLQLQGRIRPDLERGHHRDLAFGHQRIRRPGLRHLFGRQLARAVLPPSMRPASRPNRRPRSTASRSAVPSSRTACTSS